MKIFKKLLSIITIVVAAFAIGFSSSAFAAQGNATDEGGGGTPGCYVYKVNHNQITAKSTYDDTCFGGIWRKYSVNGNNSISIPNWGSVRGGTLSGCVDDGAELYYRLALVQFNTNGFLNYSKFTPVMEGGGEKQVALWPGNDFAPAGGYVTYRGTDWNSIKEKFETAKQHGAHMDGHSWPNVSMFCYSESWDSPSTEFYSTSTVEVPAQTGVNNPGSSTSPEDGTTTYSVETMEESITANFWHNITYKNGVANLPAGAVFDDVSTDWTVTETGGQNRGQIHNGTFTTNGKTTKTSDKLGYDTVTVDGLVEGATVTICHTINYNHKNVTFSNTDGTNYRNPQYANQGSSKACLEIKRVEDPNKPAGEGGFWSTTTVKVPQQNDVPGYEATTGESKSADDHEVDIKFSTDKDSVKVIFTHNMYYDDTLWKWSAYEGEEGKPVSSKDTFPDVCSTYNINWEGDVSGNIENNKQFCTKSNSSGAVVKTMEYTITNLQPDQPVTVCQKIDHDKINVEMKRKAIMKRVCGLFSCWYEFDYWEYSEGSSSGTGYTKGCVTVTRPAEPEENENSITSGGVNNWIKYAGETSTVGWNPKAISQASRRLAEYKAINYLVTARVQYHADITKGNIGLVYPNRQNIEPCNYYRGKSGMEMVWCDVLASSSPRLQQTLNLGPVRVVHTLSGSGGILGSAGGVSKTIAVPDYVGYKYCNSFGYRWEYWYSITKNGVDDWQKETRVSDYWTNYNAACRTIAKKPSAAAWNGGILTNGGVTASTSPRIHGVSETGPQAATSGQYNFVYGSWSEYLAVIHGTSNVFASGDMFSRGSSTKDLATNSPLTIANAGGAVGGSGITTSQALRTRLESYLMNHPTANLSDVYSSSATTKIVTTGSINITGDIIYPAQNYTNIYQLPQNVIFVNGDITIAPSVRRIDAWIIATGNINTCTERSNKAIATIAVNYNQNTTCDQQLVFNGPVMAGSVTLNRTYGSDPKTGSDRYVPAEIFNLSAGTYLWAYAQAGRYDSSYTEAYSRELAPRY